MKRVWSSEIPNDLGACPRHIPAPIPDPNPFEPGELGEQATSEWHWEFDDDNLGGVLVTGEHRVRFCRVGNTNLLITPKDGTMWKIKDDGIVALSYISPIMRFGETYVRQDTYRAIYCDFGTYEYGRKEAARPA